MDIWIHLDGKILPFLHLACCNTNSDVCDIADFRVALSSKRIFFKIQGLQRTTIFYFIHFHICNEVVAGIDGS